MSWAGVTFPFPLSSPSIRELFFPVPRVHPFSAPFPAVVAGRGGAGFPVTLHRTCLRLCACPVLAAGDSLRSGLRVDQVAG
jgi:hypothetical protein